MTLLIEYVDFHPDNYQGGSGKSFTFRRQITVRDELNLKPSEIIGYVEEELNNIALAQRPYSPQHERNRPVIQRIEVML